MVETGDGKKGGDKKFSSLDEALATHQNYLPDSCSPRSVFELPDVSSLPVSQGLTVVEKMHLETQILEWEEPEHRKNAADSLIRLAENVNTSLPTICRIRDILYFHNKRLGGKELASYLRKAKKLVKNKVRADQDAFDRKKTLSYPPPPGKVVQPAICQASPKKAPLTK